MALTTLWRGGTLSGASHTDGILAYLSGADYPAADLDRMADALLTNLNDEADNRLPVGCRWYPSLSTVVGPVGALNDHQDADGDLDAWLQTVFAEAWQAVEARFAEIEAAALGLPAPSTDDPAGRTAEWHRQA
jgi:hypothetical protein